MFCLLYILILLEFNLIFVKKIAIFFCLQEIKFVMKIAFLYINLLGGQENDDIFPLKIELHIKLDGQAHMRCDAQSVKKHPPSLFR